MIARVNDVLAVRGRAVAEFGMPGIVVFSMEGESVVNPVVGDVVLFKRADGWMIERHVLWVRNDPKPFGFFVAGLEQADVPIGSSVLWGADAAQAFVVPARKSGAAAVA